MSHDSPIEFPEQRLAQQLIRISADLQHGKQTDHSLVELFELLTHYGRELDIDLRARNDQASQFSPPTAGSPVNHRLSILLALLQDTEARLRNRASNVAERLEAHDATRQATASYGGVAQWDRGPQTQPAFRTQS